MLTDLAAATSLRTEAVLADLVTADLVADNMAVLYEVVVVVEVDGRIGNGGEGRWKKEEGSWCF